MRKKKDKTGLREYRAGTFDKYVAYGQRERKIKLIARGILKGFRVTCPSENSAKNLAYALRIRASRLESEEEFRCRVLIKVDGRKVYALRTKKHVI